MDLVTTENLSFLFFRTFWKTGSVEMLNEKPQEHHCVPTMMLVTRGYCESTIPSLWLFS